MNIKQAISLMLDRINNRKQFVAGTFGAFDGSAGNMYMQQRDINAAIMRWTDKHDTNGLREVAAALHMYGNLTDVEYEQIMEVIDGEK